MPKRRDQSQHDSMVSNLAAYLQKSGYQNICADISGYPQPKGIHWLNKPQSSFIPDATATKNGQFFIFEIETSDSIADEHTKAQWTIFATFARENKGTFAVIVPNNSKFAAEKRVSALNITAAVWT